MLPQTAVWPVVISLTLMAAVSSASPQAVGPLPGTPAPFDPAQWVARISAQWSTSAQYAFDGVIEIARRTADSAREVTAHSKVKVAAASGGRFLMWAGDMDHLEYLIVSDGLQTWAYMPASNQYTRQPAAAASFYRDPRAAFRYSRPRDYRDLIAACRFTPFVLASLPAAGTPTPSGRFAELDRNGEVARLPVITLLSPRSAAPSEDQTLVEIAVDPATGRVHLADFTYSAIHDSDSYFSMFRADFEHLGPGEPIPASFFSFAPSDEMKRVEELPIPGMEGTSFLDLRAPDFSAPQPSGPPFHLAGLTGRPVALIFSAGWCAPCVQQMSAAAEFQRAGYSVVAVLPGSESETAAMPAGVTTVRDPDGAVHQLFGVNFIPTTVMIDRSGTVVRYAIGLRPANQLLLRRK